jgi:hypothetical protein
MAPDNQFRFTDAEYLRLIDDEMQTRLVPLIMSVRENYYLKNSRYLIQVSDVLGFGEDNFGLFPFGSPTPISTSDLLERAIGLITKDIWYTDTNGKVQGQIPQLSFRDITSTDPVQGYYFESSKIVFHPVENFNNQNIRVHYFRKPNELCTSAECARVVFVNTGTSSIQVDAVPAGWGIGTMIDILRGKQGFDSILDSVMITGISGTDLTLDEISDTMTSGDYVTPEGKSCVAQIPVNAYPLLEQLGAIKILESMKDTAGLKNAYQQYTLLEQGFKGIISNRSQNNLKKIVGRGIWR